MRSAALHFIVLSRSHGRADRAQRVPGGGSDKDGATTTMTKHTMVTVPKLLHPSFTLVTYEVEVFTKLHFPNVAGIVSQSLLCSSLFPVRLFQKATCLGRKSGALSCS